MTHAPWWLPRGRMGEQSSGVRACSGSSFVADGWLVTDFSSHQPDQFQALRSQALPATDPSGWPQPTSVVLFQQLLTDPEVDLSIKPWPLGCLGPGSE